MKALLVFDSLLKSGDIEGVKEKELDLFALTGVSAIGDSLKKALGPDFDSLNFLDSVKAIEGQLALLRDKIAQWSADLADCRIGKRALKERLIIPDCNVSSWWFSLLSGKNTLKTDLFFKAAQLNAVKQALSSGEYSLCLVALSDKGLKKAVRKTARNLNIAVRVLRVRAQKREKKIIRNALKRLGLFGEIAGGLFYGFRLLGRGVVARGVLGRRRQGSSGRQAFMFVSYFPSTERGAAAKGIFRNNYAPFLQQKLKELDISFVWLLMYAPSLNNYTYRRAAALAGSFAEKGESLFLLEEFFSFGILLKSVTLWLGQIIKTLFLFRRINKDILYSAPFSAESGIFVKGLWRRSFYTSEALSAIVYLFVFERVFKKLPDINNCLYYLEMQAWEKALNSARRRSGRKITAIGFQHSTLSRNYLHYLYDKKELEAKGHALGLPLPDILAANGEAGHSYLEALGYTGVRTVEAVRYNYLRDKLSGKEELTQPGRPALLVAGSIHRGETVKLIRMVQAAFPKKTDNMDIYFKGHPALPLDEIFKGLAIDISEAGYVIYEGSLDACLQMSKAVLVPSSTVAIEALACGCEVIIPAFADTMPMNPLAEFEGYYYKVKSPQELFSAFEGIFKGSRLQDTQSYRSFVRSYWCLDEALPRWTQVLTGAAKQR